VFSECFYYVDIDARCDEAMTNVFTDSVYPLNDELVSIGIARTNMSCKH